VFAVHLPLVATMSDGHFLKRYLLELNLGVAVFFLISGFLLYRPFVLRLSRRRRSQDADVRMGDLVQHERPEPGVP
jgi:peptidoglycan/LPS O-acetylase OafA/YrhL